MERRRVVKATCRQLRLPAKGDSHRPQGPYTVRKNDCLIPIRRCAEGPANIVQKLNFLMLFYKHVTETFTNIVDASLDGVLPDVLVPLSMRWGNSSLRVLPPLRSQAAWSAGVCAYWVASPKLFFRTACPPFIFGLATGGKYSINGPSEVSVEYGPIHPLTDKCMLILEGAVKNNVNSQSSTEPQY